ncbi:SDR family oxidoreductase [Luteibacter pinisoli]|uniref:SDR family oxidoreductase n=1 Tax=Luteibacter pinisoli TaxID=2589080 RepID=A0A4Y5Z9S7_9GAMM|nr:SDR family oxidoreductase [Luteibacter pinisoli]QDE41289.1 SDR family oxidoreductase [Luteibacter pinisoli]
MNNLTNQGRTALVYGGSRGIGAAIVKRLAEDGYDVAFTYVSRPDAAGALVDEVAALGGNALAILADSTDASSIEHAATAAHARFGAIDAVVVNAGIYKAGQVGEVSISDLDQMLAVNVRGVFLSIQASVPLLKDGGRVVTIGSNVVNGVGSPGSSVYQLTKAAVAAMVKGLALDLAPRRITVNNVQPGPTKTDITSGFLEYLIERSPQKRVADPSEIAGAVAYFLRDDAAYVTGASLTIDGGFTL